MKLLDFNAEDIIIISKDTGYYLSLPENHAYTIILTDDLKSEISRLISDEKQNPLIALIVCLYSEYNDLKKLISVLPFTDISYQLILFGDLKEALDLKFEDMKNICDFRSGRVCDSEFLFLARKAFSYIKENFINLYLQENYYSRLMDTRRDQEDLINIGRSLSTEKDPDQLLKLILYLSKRITGADAGSIYLVEDDEFGSKRLRFKQSHTFSRDIPLQEFVMPLNKDSISGYVAVTGEVLNIPDAYKISCDAPYSHNSSFDKEYNYITRSMLVVPMKNYTDSIIGVIQLINCKEDNTRRDRIRDEAFTIKLESIEDFNRFVSIFDEKYNSLMEAVAGQAAIAIENNRMIIQIQKQFEEFVKASVSAIESRDPATSGHSFRVASICREMALTINNINDGYLADVRFTASEIREIELAALLHDFGKVYIDLAVFKKAQKLYPKDFENLMLRMDYLYRFVELNYAAMESRIKDSEFGIDYISRALFAIKEEKANKLKIILDIKSSIQKMNEPAVRAEECGITIDDLGKKINEIDCLGVDGIHMDIMLPCDMNNLAIRSGSLNSEERMEIESHVMHTYGFVSKIPWPPEYKNIPEITIQHHEKINGKGYPRGLLGRESLLIQSRIMAIADIYDALSAGDRPYKKSLTKDKVLAILREESDNGALDPDLVSLFIDKDICGVIYADKF